MITIARPHFEKLCTSRKMLLDEVVNKDQISPDVVQFETIEDVEQCARKLVLPVSLLLEGVKSSESAARQGVTIAKLDQAYTRTSQRGGRDYYTYQHLVVTPEQPNLMPLRITLHCNDEEHVVLNPGHESNELCYVEAGDVRFHWEDDSRVRQSADLAPGDSVFISSGASHSFMARSKDAVILAFNW